MAKEGDSAAMHDPGVDDSMYAAVQSENNLLSSIYLIYRYVCADRNFPQRHADRLVAVHGALALQCALPRHLIGRRVGGNTLQHGPGVPA